MPMNNRVISKSISTPYDVKIQSRNFSHIIFNIPYPPNSVALLIDGLDRKPRGEVNIVEGRLRALSRASFSASFVTSMSDVPGSLGFSVSFTLGFFIAGLVGGFPLI